VELRERRRRQQPWRARRRRQPWRTEPKPWQTATPAVFLPCLPQGPSVVTPTSVQKGTHGRDPHHQPGLPR
jgi:hypothetical protein